MEGLEEAGILGAVWDLKRWQGDWMAGVAARGLGVGSDDCPVHEGQERAPGVGPATCVADKGGERRVAEGTGAPSWEPFAWLSPLVSGAMSPFPQPQIGLAPLIIRPFSPTGFLPQFMLSNNLCECLFTLLQPTGRPAPAVLPDSHLPQVDHWSSVSASDLVGRHSAPRTVAW